MNKSQSEIEQEEISAIIVKHGRFPDQYNVREKIKSQYCTIYSNTDLPIKSRGDALWIYIRAHFDRSLSSAINKECWEQHPTFDVYLKQYNAMNHLIDDNLKNHMVTRFGLGTAEELIKEGMTYVLENRLQTDDSKR